MGCLDGASAADAEPESTATGTARVRLCGSIDANSIVIKGAGSPFKEGSLFHAP